MHGKQKELGRQEEGQEQQLEAGAENQSPFAVSLHCKVQSTCPQHRPAITVFHAHGATHLSIVTAQAFNATFPDVSLSNDQAILEAENKTEKKGLLFYFIFPQPLLSGCGK